MQNQTKITTVLLIVAFALLSSIANAKDLSQTETFIVTFASGKADVDSVSVINARVLADVVRFIDGNRDRITGITFSGSASPDGSETINQRLAGKRLDALEQYVRSHVDLSGISVDRDNRGEDWALLEAMIGGTPVSYGDTALVVMGNKEQLRSLRHGWPWADMRKRFFPKMRRAAAVMVTVAADETDSETATQEPTETQETITSEETAEAEPLLEPVQRGGFCFAIKTNALYDLALVPNVGVEVPIGRWSVAANWDYAWWRSDRRHNYWRTYGGDIEVRRWLGKRHTDKLLAGHHVGLYAQMLTYDFELGGKGYLGDKWSYAAGAAYGFSLPLSRRLRFDFSIGVGYMGGKYKTYEPEDGCYVWKSTRQRHYVGPTKAEASVVWIIGKLPKKGGTQ